MKNLISLVLFSLIGIAIPVFAQKSLTNPTLFGTVTFASGTTMAGVFIPSSDAVDFGGPSNPWSIIYSSGFSIPSGAGYLQAPSGQLTLTGQPIYLNSTGSGAFSIQSATNLNLLSGGNLIINPSGGYIEFGQGTSTPVFEIAGSINPTVEFLPNNGGSLTFQNATTNGAFTIESNGTGAVELTSPSGNVNLVSSAGGIYIAAASGIVELTASAIVMNGPAQPPLAHIETMGTSSKYWSTTYSQHYSGANAAPTISTLSGAGSGATASITGNDTAGLITVNTGTVSGTGDVCQITFSAAYDHAPYIVIYPANQQTSGIGTQMPVNSGNVSTTSWEINGTSYTTLPSNTTLEWFYHVIE